MEKSKSKGKGKLNILFMFLLFICVFIGSLIVYTQFFKQEEISIDDLFSDYQLMLDDIGEPVSNPTIPTIGQVSSWLHLDNTDEAFYRENVYMCGDFSVTLVVSAKENNWRMYVAIMYYSFFDGEGYGERDPYGDYGHAFNMIYCQDGDDLGTELDIWYIEPQSDVIWQLNYDHYDIYTYYSGGLAGTVWVNIYWVNYYTYLG